MARFLYTSHGLGSSLLGEEDSISNNNYKTASYTPEIMSQIERFNLTRIAGNVFECKSTRDFWQVRGNKVVKLVGSEVNYGETLTAAPKGHPDDFLQEILSSLEL